MPTNTPLPTPGRPLRWTLVVVGCAVVLCSAIPQAASAQDRIAPGTPVASPARAQVVTPALTHGAVGVKARVRDGRGIWIGPGLVQALAESLATAETRGAAARLEEGSVLATGENLGVTRRVTLAYLGT